MRAWPGVLMGFLLAGAVAGAAILLWRLFAGFHGTAANANVIVGGLALTGVLVTAAVSVVGLSLKQSIDRRTLELSQAEHRRQQMETAMQTVRLLAADGGALAPKTQVSAALLVLARLGEMSLAVDLAAELWPKDQLTCSAAVRIIDDALNKGDPPLQRDAAVLLLNNVERLDVGENQYEWPDSLQRWPGSLDAEARLTVALTLSKWTKVRKPTDSDDFRLTLLREAGERDPGQNVRKTAAELVKDQAP